MRKRRGWGENADMNDDIESERKADAGEYQGPDRVYAKTEVHLHCFHILHYQKKKLSCTFNTNDHDYIVYNWYIANHQHRYDDLHYEICCMVCL